MRFSLLLCGWCAEKRGKKTNHSNSLPKDDKQENPMKHEENHLKPTNEDNHVKPSSPTMNFNKKLSTEPPKEEEEGVKPSPANMDEQKKSRTTRTDSKRPKFPSTAPKVSQKSQLPRSMESTKEKKIKKEKRDETEFPVTSPPRMEDIDEDDDEDENEDHITGTEFPTDLPETDSDDGGSSRIPLDTAPKVTSRVVRASK